MSIYYLIDDTGSDKSRAVWSLSHRVGREKPVSSIFVLIDRAHSKRSSVARELPPPTGIAFGEVACARRAITNKFALYSLARNFVLFRKRENFYLPDGNGAVI